MSRPSKINHYCGATMVLLSPIAIANEVRNNQPWAIVLSTVIACVGFLYVWANQPHTDWTRSADEDSAR